MVAVLGVLTSCGSSPPDALNTTPEAVGHHFIATVTDVVDGDTLIVDRDGREEVVRLLGINAPEVDECLHEGATGYLTDILSGRTVGVEDHGTDRFGRGLAYLWLGDSLVNEGVAARGLAIATTPDDGDPLGASIVSAEEAAAAEGLGLWAEDVCGAAGTSSGVRVDSAISFDPPGPDEEALEEEWVRFGSARVVDAGGWAVRDESSANRCLLPPGSLIAPNRSLTVTSADSCWGPDPSPVWNNEGDIVLLLDDSGRFVAWSRYTD